VKTRKKRRQAPGGCPVGYGIEYSGKTRRYQPFDMTERRVLKTDLINADGTGYSTRRGALEALRSLCSAMKRRKRRKGG